MRKVRSRVACLSAAIATVVFGGVSAQAQSRDLTWDLDNGSAGASGQNGFGYWENQGVRNWVDSNGVRVAWDNNNPDSAIFGSTNTAFVAGALPNSVFLGGLVTVKNITLGVGSNGTGYNIYTDDLSGGGPLTITGNITKTANGGQLQLRGDRPFILAPGNHVFAMNDTPGDVPEIMLNGPISGTGDLTVDNGIYQAWGTLEVNVDNRGYSGKININKGRIAITDAFGLGDTSVGTTISGLGTLSFGGAGSQIPGGTGLTITEPITITRNTYGGADPEAGRYPGAVISYGGAGVTNTIAGPLVIDSTEARIRANTSTLVVSSVITTGTNAGSILAIDGDTAGFVRLTANNSGANSLSVNGIRVVGGELLLDNDNQYGGTAAPLRFSGGYVRFNNAYHTSFAGMNINLGSFGGGIDVPTGTTFNIPENLTGTSLSMRGGGTMNIGGNNLLTGASFYDAGIVNVTGSHSIGGLRMRNATMNVNSGATLTTTGTFTSIGIDPGENATLNIMSGATLVAANQDFNVGDNGNATLGSRGTLNLESGSTATINGNFEIGKNQNVVGVVNQKGANLTANRELWVGNNIGGNGTFTQSAGSTTVGNWLAIGRLGATGTVDLSGGTITKNGGGNTYIGESTGAVTSSMTVRGTGSLIINSGELWLGNAGGSKGVLTIRDSGLVRVANNWLAIGRNGASTGTLNLEGGTLEKAGGGNLTIGSGNSTGTLTQTGGTLTSNNTYVGEGGTALMDLRNGTASLGRLVVGRNGPGGELRVSGSAAATAGAVWLAGGVDSGDPVEATPGTINLNGGSLTANSIGHGKGTGPATLNFNGGTLKAGLDGANLLSGLTAANVQTPGAIIDSNGKNVTMSQALSGAAGDGGLTKVGAGTLTASSTAHTYTGATKVNGGTLAVTGSVFNSSGVTVNTTGTFQAPVSQTVKTLTVNTGGVAQLPSSGTAGARIALTVGNGLGTAPLTIAGSGASAGRVDLDRNGLIVDVAAGSESATLTALRVAAGNAYHGGLWDQPGLTSSLITSTNKLAVGFGLPSDAPVVTAGGTQFFGSPVDASSVVARATIGGDATLDGVVNFDDLLTLAKNYNSSTAYWAKGDFDYNGNVNFDDLLTLAKNYNQAMPTEPIPGATAEFKADMAAAFAAAVPEPTSLAFFGLAGAALLGGRRRRSTGSGR